MNTTWMHWLAGRIRRLAAPGLPAPTVKHGLLFILCLWAMWAQTHYPIPNRYFLLVVPWLGTTMTGVSFLILVNSLLAYVTVESSVRAWFTRLQQWADGCILLFVGFSLVLFLNGRLDFTKPPEQKSKILRVEEVGGDLLDFVPYAWIDLQSWENPAETLRILRPAWGQSHLWPGEPVLVQVNQGYWGIPWVAGLQQDADTYDLDILKAHPTAALPLRRVILGYLDKRDWNQAFDEASRYFTIYPKDAWFAYYVANTFVAVGELKKIVALFDPLVDGMRNARLYEHVGWALSRANNLARSAERFRAQIRLAPDDYTGYYHLGFVLKGLGRPEESLRTFETALALRHGLPDAEITAQITLLKQMLAKGHESQGQAVTGNPHH